MMDAMQTHDQLSAEERRAAARKPPAPESSERSPLELAGQIGNSGMQRVAGSPSLQRSPAAAGLIQRAPVAEDELAEAAANQNAAAPDAAGNANAAEASGNDNAAEASGNDGGTDSAEELIDEEG